jgi:hypothetical protein
VELPGAHLSDRYLIGMVCGDLPSEEAASVKAHLKLCKKCAELYKTYSRLSKTLAEGKKMIGYDVEKIKIEIKDKYERLYLRRAPFEVKFGSKILRFLRVGPGLWFFENILLGQTPVTQLHSAVRGTKGKGDFDTEAGRVVMEVLDEKGNAVSGVTLQLKGPKKLKVVTNERGQAEVLGLPEGGYDVKIAPKKRRNL